MGSAEDNRGDLFFHARLLHAHSIQADS